MDCVNHNGVQATAFCQNCGKALCSGCVRSAARGELFCEACRSAWQRYQQPYAQHGPNPQAAAVLGVIPGVGAMYNGQFFKGFVHVIVFAVLISITNYYPIFGLFIAAWILYQSFEAYHTARALRDGQPAPDPLGLNEVSNWLNQGRQAPYSAPWQAAANPAPTPGPRPTEQAAAEQPASGYPRPNVAPPQQYPDPFQKTQYQPPYQAPYQAPNPAPGCWGRREPVGAIVLIALGLLFLLGQLDIFHGRFFDFAWPLLLIALGVWLIVRRIGDSQGGCK